MKSLLAAGTILLALAGPAFASQCPALIMKAQEAMKTATLDEAAMTKINEHITLAQSQHDAGKHAESEVTINDALTLIGA